MEAPIKTVSFQDEVQEAALSRPPGSALPSAALCTKGPALSTLESGCARPTRALHGATVGPAQQQRRSLPFVHERTPRKTPRNRRTAQVAAYPVRKESNIAPMQGCPSLTREVPGEGCRRLQKTVATLGAASCPVPLHEALLAVRRPSGRPLAAEELRPPLGFRNQLQSASAEIRR